MSAGLHRAASLGEQAREAIWARLITGELQPGRIYSVPSLAESLRVSATPVREAMLELAAEGLVEAVRNKGFRPVTLSEHDLMEIFELRMLLEVPAAGRAADIITKERVETCRLHATEIEQAAARGDLTGFLEADRDFHLTLLGALDNQRLVDTVAKLRDQSRLYGLPQLARRGELSQTASEHRAILQAVGLGDGATAQELTRRHLEHTRGIWAGRREP